MNGDHELIDAYLDGELTAEEEARLADWLAADPGHMRVFVRETHLHRQLREIMLADSFQAGIEMPGEKTERTGRRLPVDLIGRAIGQWFAFPATQMLRRPWPLGAFCLALIIGTGVWLFGPTMGQPTLAEIHGAGFSIERAGQSVPARIGTPLQSGDVLRTSSKVTAMIDFAPEATQITLQSGTELTLADLSHGKRLGLRTGKLEASVAHQRPFRPMLITTPQAEARVIGTRFILTVQTNSTRLDVTKGLIRFTRASDDQFIRVGADHFAVAAANYELSELPFTGGILREYWTNAPGEYHPTYLTSNTNYPDHPSGRDYLTNFETFSYWGTNYGARFRGYLLPTTTGDYNFWITAGDGGDLYLSPDNNPDHRQQIAHWGGPDGNTQQSTPLPLKAGCEYYIEVLQKTGNADSHLAIDWQGPGRNREVIPGEFLSPWKPK